MRSGLQRRSWSRRSPGAEGHPLALGGVAAGVGAQAGRQRNEVPAQRGRIACRVPASRGADRELSSAIRSKLQHPTIEGALDRSGVDIQKRLWADLERIRLEYERLIHAELRLIRQRSRPVAPATAVPAPAVAASAAARAAAAFDYGRFAERFRGSEEYVKKGQQFYLPYFTGRREVLDIGCGRGEFLELMREAGVPARGIDLSAGIRRPVPPKGPAGGSCRPVRLSGGSAGRLRWTASSARRWWSICRRSACRR